MSAEQTPTFKVDEDCLHTENLLFRMVCDATGLEIGIYPVMFGYRVRYGKIGCGFTETDWCAGADVEQIIRAYAYQLTLLEDPCLDNSDIPPTSQVKPFKNDTDFIRDIHSLLADPDTFEANLARLRASFPLTDEILAALKMSMYSFH